MPARQHQPGEIVQQVVPLVLLGIGLVTSNRLVTMIDDESLILDAATSPVRATLAAFLSGPGQHAHPPLYDLLLHFWLGWTGGSFDYLRIPSILFFLAGLFLLGRASRPFTGKTGGTAVIWLGVLWPFGFHFGRLATWYSFSFFLVSGLMLAYFKALENQTLARWALFLVFAVSLIWTNYLGWAILGCLGIDQVFRQRSKEPVATPKALAGTFALLCVSFLPLLRAFLDLPQHAINLHESARTILGNLAFSVYSLFVSESIAPWYWRFSIPAGLAVLGCVVLVTWWIPRAARRFLFYSALLLMAMALIGILNTKRLLMISPWILLPAGVALETAKPRWASVTLTVALLVIGCAGWYGIYSRRYYSAPRFIEPWPEIASEAAAKIASGATVIADHPSFLLYLTYSLQVPRQNGPWRFAGVLPVTVKDPHVFSSAGWMAAGHLIHGKMILVRGAYNAKGNEAIDESAHLLDQSCGSISSRLRMRDEGYAWKQRFFPQLHEPQWRIEIREYDCDSSPSKQIYPIPAR